MSEEQQEWRWTQQAALEAYRRAEAAMKGASALMPSDPLQRERQRQREDSHVLPAMHEAATSPDRPFPVSNGVGSHLAAALLLLAV